VLLYKLQRDDSSILLQLVLQGTSTLFVSLITHQSAILFSQNKPAISNILSTSQTNRPIKFKWNQVKWNSNVMTICSNWKDDDYIFSSDDHHTTSTRHNRPAVVHGVAVLVLPSPINWTESLRRRPASYWATNLQYLISHSLHFPTSSNAGDLNWSAVGRGTY
jgi:hypothetical protein